MRKLLLALVMLLVPSLALAATSTVNLAWDANTEPDLTGYRLYQSATPDGSFVQIQQVGLVTTTSVPGLPDGLHCWRLTAFDTVGNESGPSNTVCFSGDTTPPAAPGYLKITSTVAVP